MTGLGRTTMHITEFVAVQFHIKTASKVKEAHTRNILCRECIVGENSTMSSAYNIQPTKSPSSNKSNHKPSILLTIRPQTEQQQQN